MRRTRGFGLVEALVALAVVALLVFVVVKGIAWATQPTVPQPVPAPAPNPTTSWGASVHVGTPQGSPAPTGIDFEQAYRRVREAEEKAAAAETARQQAEARLAQTQQQLQNEQLLVKALSRLEAGQLVQARAELAQWAGGQIRGFGDTIILASPLPPRAVKLLLPVYRVAKQFDPAGHPRWVVKLDRDDAAMRDLP